MRPATNSTASAQGHSSPASGASEPELMTKDETCAKLNLATRTLENMVKARRFPPGVRKGRNLYLSRRAIDEFVRREFAVQEAFWRTEIPRK